MPKQIFYVKGMHCASCEIVIEKELLSISGVKFADASLAKGEVSIGYDGEKPGMKKLNERFGKMGYEFSEAPFKENKKEFWKIAAAILASIGAFILITDLGFSSLISVSSESALPAFFVFGLIAGVSSCAALVGGLVLSLSKRWLKEFGDRNETDKMKPHFLFNAGRLVSFSALGALLGVLGERVKVSPAVASIVIIAVSAVMLIVALQMMGIKRFSRFRISLPKSFSRFVERGGKPSFAEPFSAGFLTFLLPCGFTLVAEGFAVLSGSPLRGAAIMGLFVLGTAVPLLFIGFYSSRLLSNHKVSETFMKIAGALIVFFVAYNLNFQFGITRYFGELAGRREEAKTEVLPPSKNAETIKMIYTNKTDISPDTITVKAGKSVRIEIEVRDTSYGCMSTIMIPGLWNKPLAFVKGKTLIMEFTPKKAGEYQITCAMGVPRGTVKVIK